MQTSFVCNNRNCGQVATADELLKAVHPFDPEDYVYGCPKCKDIGSMVGKCWKCDRPATSGTPTDKHGYVWSCYDHKPSE